MKKLIAVLLAALMLFALAGCRQEEQPEENGVARSFIAGYEENVNEEGVAGRSSRVLMNLMRDGTVEFYVGVLDNGEHSTAQYSGTYTMGENDEFDETISVTYTYGEGETAEVTDAVIIDDIFEMPFYLLDGMTEGEIKFYETAPAFMDGDVYVGYMTKTGGMGAMVYAYSLCLKEDMTFDVSIMQLASVMHVWGGTSGTYTVDGECITFTYDILTTDGEVVSANETSVGSGYTDTQLAVGFNIQQATMRASDSPFIRVK